MAYQRAYLPMKVLTLSQGYGKNSYSHKNGLQLDLCGKDGGKDPVLAPFDCKVTKLYVKQGHSFEVWLTSTKKVLCKNGYYGYLTMSITHPTEIKYMTLGQTFKQHEIMCYEGKEGGATGNHIHLELSLGTKAGWKVVNGDYVNVNNVPPEEYLFAYDDAIIKCETYQGRNYHFTKEKDMIKKVVNVPSEPLLIHTKPNYSNLTILDEKGLKNGDEVIVFKTDGSMSLIYNYERLGWTASKYLA